MNIAEKRKIKPGQVYYVDFDPSLGYEQQKTRPAVIVSSKISLTTDSPFVCVVPITHTKREQFKHHTKLNLAINRLNEESFAMTDQFRTLDILRIDSNLLTTTSSGELNVISNWIQFFTNQPTFTDLGLL